MRFGYRVQVYDRRRRPVGNPRLFGEGEFGVAEHAYALLRHEVPRDGLVVLDAISQEAGRPIVCRMRSGGGLAKRR